MAGDWIKIEAATPEKPEVMRLGRIIGISPLAAFGYVVKFWIWLDRNSVDGVVDDVQSTDIDVLLSLPGFAQAMKEVGWLTFDDQKRRIAVPSFDVHNGESAKKRALKSRAQANWRRKNVDQSLSTTTSTREEKRRDIIKPKVQRAAAPVFAVPEGITPECWGAYLKGRKKKLTPYAHKLIVEKLAAIPLGARQAVLEKSIANGWTGLFPEGAPASATSNGVDKAWSVVLAALKGNKEARRAASESQATAAAIQAMGGWSSMSALLERELPFKAKEFKTEYQRIVAEAPEWAR